MNENEILMTTFSQSLSTSEDETLRYQEKKVATFRQTDRQPDLQRGYAPKNSNVPYIHIYNPLKSEPSSTEIICN